MIKVECPGCKAPYQVDERRVPDVGLKMRCPKCATSFVVTKPGSPGAKAAAPKPTAPAAPRPAAPKPAPRPAAPPPADDAGDEWDLPAPTADRGARGAPPPARRPVAAAPPPVEDVEEDIDLPIVASGPSAPRPGAFVPGRPPGVGLPSAGGAAAARAPAPSPSGGGKSGAFGEIDLLVDLPVPEGEDPDDAEIDLPVARDARPAFARTGAAVPPGPPAKGARPAASPDAVRARTQLFGDTVPEPAEVAPVGKAAPIRVPVPARDSRPGAKGGAKGAGAARAAAAAPPPPPPSDEGLGFGEIDLPLLASEADLPAAAAGLPTPMDGAGLPARQQPGLPVATPGSSLPVATDGTSLPLRGRVPTPIGDPRASSPGFDRASSPGFERASSSSFDRASSPGFDRASSVGFDRASSPGFERKSSADLGRDAGPNIHGPGHIAGADIYSGALYDDRHMDPAFRAEARSVVTKLPTEDDADEAPLMTTSGAPVAPAPGPTVGRATMPDPGARAAFASEPRIGAIAAEERLSRGAAGASMADLIDRTSIELDLIEPTAPPAAPVGPLPPIDRSAKTMPAVPQGTPAPFGVEESIGADPMSVPDLSSTPAPVIPVQRFGVDPFADPSSDPFSGGSAEVGDEAPLAPPDVGDEADLGAKGPTIRTPSVGKLPPMPEAPASTDSPVAGRPWKKYVLVLAIAGLLTGAGLTLVPDIGPFGLNFVSDRVNKKLHDDALDTARNIIHDDLEADTSAGADSAIGKVKTAQHAYPRHRATAGYAAYVAYLRILRFGPRAEDKAFGDMMIRVSQDRQSDFLLLGQAAQDAVVGQIARARQTMQGLLERRPDDIDVAVLAGEIELLAKSGDQATRVWQKAVEIKKIPRTLFGLARAQFAGGDLIGAEASARNTLSLSPKHVGARILLADVVWQSSAREAQALELLGKVTEDGEIRKSAGDPELVAAYTLLGHIHLAKSRMTQAEAAFAAALKLDPQAVNALVGNGELFYRSGRFSEAVARYEAAIRADADSVPAKIGMAKTELFLERAKDSKDLLKKLCETRPNEPLAFYWLGRAEEVLGNKKDAEAAYTNAIKVGGDSPQTVEAYVALAQLLSSLGRADDANARLTEAGNRFPGLAALYRARGEVAMATGNYAEAKKELETALAREEDIATRFKLGSVLRRMRDYDEAAKIFDAISETDKDFPGLALERGLLFEETGQSDRASEMYAKALQSAPNDLDLKLRVGSTQVMAGHARQAEPILRDVYRSKPNSAEVNHFLGRALLVRGISLAEAKRFLERAAEIDPNRAEYHLYVGWVANELGETQLAESALQRAIELDRNLGDAYWQRGVLLQKQGQAIDALADLKIALEKSPSRFEVYATMAFCYQDQSKWPEAEDAWKRAIAGNDAVAEWHYRLAKVYVTRNNRALAAPELARAVELAEAPDKPTPGWLAEAHFLLGEAYRATAKDKAKHHYQRFLELAPQGHAYRIDAERALATLPQ